MADSTVAAHSAKVVARRPTTAGQSFDKKWGTGPKVSGSRTSGNSTSTSVNLVATPFPSVQALYSLPEWQSLLFVRGSCDTVPAFKQPYCEAPFFEGMHLPNPYHDAESFRKAFRGDASGQIGQ